MVAGVKNKSPHHETGPSASAEGRSAERAPAARGRRILPIAERLRADDQTAGRGVTIAFLDSGFFAHPDLTTPRDRILAYHAVVDSSGARSTSATPARHRAPPRGPRSRRSAMPSRALHQPDVSAWHGMMTSVVAAGNGALSNGRYRGLAHEAELVLVKVGSAQRILHDDIRRGIEWVIAHRERYGIRVLNISCGGDYEASYLVDGLSRAADAAVRAGIAVVAAVGNEGHGQRSVVLPPASAPSVIAVGGFDDGGEGLHEGGYHSSFGPTIDGLQKPEIIAPAIFLAAPILPGTPTADQARLYALLDSIDDGSLRSCLHHHAGIDPDLDAVADRDAYLIRQILAAKQHDQKVISGHYKHVDGTSFAAPIVSSVVAQMIEVNPKISPQRIKTLLIETARRLRGIPPERQGWGVVQPKAAVEAARHA